MATVELRRSRLLKAKIKDEIENGETEAKPPAITRKRKKSNEAHSKDERVTKKALKAEQKSKENRDASLLIGAHVSASGGLQNAVHNAVAIGATAFGLFLRSQRQWQSKPLEENTVETFKAACAQYKFPPHAILPHGSYLVNLGSPNEATLAKSQDAFIEEMTRCQRLGITQYNFHPGSTCGEISVDECVKSIAEGINLALSKTEGVVAVIENMSRQGNTIGGDFREIRSIIDLVEDKSRVGVCLDTCHAFAAGYDISCEKGYEEMMTDFEEIIGFKYLKGMHLNDSKAGVGSHLDRHENIGRGKIGRDGFRRVVNDVRLRGIPMILETPMTIDDEEEIRLLRSLVIC